MSLADGFAAIVGVRYGKANQYKVFGHIKSYVGSLTFFIFSVATLLALTHFSNYHLSSINIAMISIAATLIENMGVRGSDNILVPMLVALMIRAA